MAVNEIRYKGVSYATDDDIKVPSGILYEVKALRSDSLEANSLTVTVFSNDKAIMGFAKNDKVEYFRDGRRVGVYYLQTVERVGSDAYTLSALSALGRLITMRHVGGIYTGQTVAEVVPQICGPVEVMIESVYASRQLYGYLPYSNPDTRTGNGRSARDNLSQVLFAIGASLGTDENGVMRVEKLWDGVSGTVTADQINEDSCSTVYETPVSAVEITEHQWVPNTQTVSLFEGAAEEGALITFDEPVHDLTAQGFSILESGANYAVVSAGTGTLTGQGYTHLTRIVRRTVTEGAEENVVPITEATLVSLTNSVDVANRMADYYRHRETIQVDVEPGAEHAGSVVRIFHPWDKEMVQACVESRETVISGILSSQTRALVGFVPPQPDTAEYLDERVILTDAGTWTMPDGAVTLRAVLIGKGSDGTAGNPGGSNTLSGSTRPNTSSATFSAGAAGKGGSGGTGGDGGKINIITLEPEAGQTFAYDTTGDEVTFGTYSSADGAASEAGYFDSTTLEYFGRKGADGVSGGDGGAVGASGKSVGDYFGGHGTESKSIQHKWTASGTTYTDRGSIQGFGGGGAAKGRNGLSANGYIRFQAFGFTPDVSVNSDADGASGSAGDDGANYGDGGGGGNGGGGAGATGSVSVSFTPSAPSGERTQCSWSGVWLQGGSGGAGGAGKKGCVILYYRKPKPVQSGALRTSDGRDMLDALDRRMIV